MSDEDIKQKRRCKCCNKMYDYAVPNSHATRFFCEECTDLPEPIRKVLASFNKRLVELEDKAKAPQKNVGSK
jgi:hypothetical protein